MRALAWIAVIAAIGALSLRNSHAQVTSSTGSTTFLPSDAARSAPSRQERGAWRPPTVISGLPGNLHSPSTVAVGDTTYIAANVLPLSYRAPLDTPIVVIARIPGGRVSPPPGAFQFVYPRLVVDARKRVHLFWTEFAAPAITAMRWEDQPAALWHSMMQRDGWSPAEEVLRAPSLNWNDRDGTVVADSSAAGDVYAVVPVSLDGGHERLIHLRLHLGRWERHDSPFLGLAASLVATSHNILVTVYQGLDTAMRGERNGLLVMRSSTLGATWSAPIMLDRASDDEVPVSPMILHVGDTLSIVWARRPRAGFTLRELRRVVSTDAGEHWGAAATVPLDAWSAVGFDAAVATCGEVGAVVQLFDGKTLALGEIYWTRFGAGKRSLMTHLAVVRDASLLARGHAFELSFAGWPPTGAEFLSLTTTRPACERLIVR